MDNTNIHIQLYQQIMKLISDLKTDGKWEDLIKKVRTDIEYNNIE